MVVQPPEARKSPVMFHLFPEQLRENNRFVLRRIAEETLAAGNKACVVFSRSTERWGQAFDIALYAEKN